MFVSFVDRVLNSDTLTISGVLPQAMHQWIAR